MYSVIVGTSVRDSEVLLRWLTASTKPYLYLIRFIMVDNRFDQRLHQIDPLSRIERIPQAGELGEGLREVC